MDTPGVEHVLHFNNAGAALMPLPVHRALEHHLALERDFGGYEAEERARRGIEDFYTAFAELLGCHRDEIAYLENATRAWDMAFYSIPFHEGDSILTGEAEYASNAIAFLQMAERKGVKVEVVPSDGFGQLDVEALERRVRSAPVRLIAITHVPTQSGLVNPAAEIGRIARANGILYLLDACQSLGQMPVDVEAIGCDMLSGTGRKYLRGPRGTGVLYVRQSALRQLDPAFLDLHAATWIAPDAYAVRPGARRFENWESFVAGRIGLRAAVRYALNLGLDNVWQSVEALGNELRERLADVKGVKVRDRGRVRCGIVTLTKDGEDAAAIRQRLSAEAINVTISTASSSCYDRRWLIHGSVLRASLHYYNSSWEIERFCSALNSR
jgi:selenocysteine lyase/cysteine desulfurase